jgi:hypothetical protein
MFLLPLLLINQIVINEVMANPKGKTGPGCPEDRNEFVEIYNNSNDTINLLGWRISDFDARDTIVPWTDTTILQKYPNLKITTALLPPRRYALILDCEYTQTGNGEFIMPYNFPESLIVFTVGNTTIGDELAMNDSLISYSPDSTSISTFFSPKRTKDGFSLERVSPESEDKEENWIECLDSSGSTPGYENSTLTFIDPELSHLDLLKEERLKIYLWVKNRYYADCGPWRIEFKANGTKIGEMDGENLKPRQETLILYFPENLPPKTRKITAQLFCPKDKDTSNNFLTAYLPAEKEAEVILSSEVISPDNDGKDDYLIINLLLEEETDITIEVFNLFGRKVRRIYQGKWQRNQEFIWDGKDDDKKFLPRGIYLLSISYKKEGKERIIKKTCILAGKFKG